jgi:hypothetical protein
MSQTGHAFVIGGTRLVEAIRLISKQVGTANELAKPFRRVQLAGLLFQSEDFHAKKLQ